MLNINDIKNAGLTKTMMGGYKIDEVDSLLNEVCATFEAYEKQRAELTKKLKILGDRVEQYRNDEQNIKDAIDNAQKRKSEIEAEAEYNAKRIMETADRKTEEVKARLQKEVENALDDARQTRADASEDAARIISDAQSRADAIIRDARIQQDSVNAEIEKAKQDYIDLQEKIVLFRNELIEKYKSHLQVIVGLPSSDSVQDTARQLDEMYPTREKSKTHLQSYQERFEAVENDFDEIIQRTLEFDTQKVKEEAERLSAEKAKENTPDNNRQEQFTTGEFSTQKQKVKVSLPDRHSRINYTSRTIDTAHIDADDEVSEDDDVKIVDVNKKDMRDNNNKSSRFF
ncbi:MAG: DivIVA domain-containing protein [Clostridiales bacterium]|nr:DivIVA domain-containing protein [Clostridiales bacterium]